jgi:hypothetical protein
MLGTANWARIITKINRLSIESEYSTKYAAKNSVPKVDPK